MKTTVDLPDSLYQKGEAIAASRGSTIEQLIVRAVEKEVLADIGGDEEPAADRHEVALPLLRSKRPGTLDLSTFDFDDLLT